MDLDRLSDYVLSEWFSLSRREAEESVRGLREAVQPAVELTDLELLLLWEKFCHTFYGAGFMLPVPSAAEEFARWLARLRQ